MLTRALVPLKESAPPYFPDVDHVVFDVVPLLPVPEASPTVVPLPSLNEYAATSPGVAARVEPTANSGSISSAAASAKAARDRLAEHADSADQANHYRHHPPSPEARNADSGSSTRQRQTSFPGRSARSQLSAATWPSADRRRATRRRAAFGAGAA